MTAPTALTDAQVMELAKAIAAAVCRNMGGMGHMREQVEGWVWSELADTPFLGGAPTRTGVVYVPTACGCCDCCECGVS